MSFEGKDTILSVVRREAEQLFALADSDEAWTAPTGAGHWQVRDVVAHIVDTTEAYFESFDSARGGKEAPPAYGLPGMADRVDAQAQALHDIPRAELLDRLRTDLDKITEIFQGLTEEDWTGLQVPHFYMGPLPAFFYPAFQLMDYGVHTWDVRQGSGRAHGLPGDVADLLTPFMFVLWKYTITDAAQNPCEIGIRVTSGPNAGDTRVSIGSEGMDYAPGDVSDLTVLEFDPGSFVLTAFGRSNSGSVRGNPAVADTFLNEFFRI
ncbi:MAG: maleylpyruvate isomerase family mycothiol-dependent enzyme [Nocardioidaceae bacterium]|nr:maleylpyruvate isomerase family mycothiol-dependent enzyme [Nocardioidaceae bacterium]NUS50734.1 maleylpyruvate isomerase family mycothiol-dependent enzyme [Nocardioidaceae bacterium]